MQNPRQLRNSTFGLSLGAALVALAAAFVLIVVMPQPAQAQTFTVIHNFSGGEDGASPYAGVTLDGAGNVYGTANSGGIGYGTVYKLKNRVWTLDPLYEFTGGSDGANPEARVIFGPNGTLYGTTVTGGVFNLRPYPTVCKTALCPWMETELYYFQGGSSDGFDPEYGDLKFDGLHNIYGTTFYGGNINYNNGYGAGVVYKLAPSGGGYEESVLYAFSVSDGEFPINGVIFDGSGNIYGTTYQGGLSNSGTVFELMPVRGGWTDCTLNNFRNGTDGGYLYAGVIFDPSGTNLYGATSNGGTGEGGTVFELTPIGNCSWTLNTLYSFTETTAPQCGPRGSLVLDGAGNLYGTTYCDGAHGFGNIFKLTPQGSYTSLYDFTGGSDGGNPISNAVLDSSGNLYGTASTGGTQNVGVVWEITPPPADRHLVRP
jgi:uncharacterized repeat protein (TIGR03803 family)